MSMFGNKSTQPDDDFYAIGMPIQNRLQFFKANYGTSPWFILAELRWLIYLRAVMKDLNQPMLEKYKKVLRYGEICVTCVMRPIGKHGTLVNVLKWLVKSLEYIHWINKASNLKSNYPSKPDIADVEPDQMLESWMLCLENGTY